MDLSFTAEYQAFRAEVRQFLAQNWQRRERGADQPGAEDVAAFRCRAVEAGYLYRNIPREYGGSGQPADVLKAQIIGEEFGRARAPLGLAGVGMQMLVPTLLDLGTPQQKAFFIPGTVTGEYRWAQGYSEPGSGSDLASVRTRAQQVGDKWIINGQKVWSTRAHQAHYMFALVRTEPKAPKHAGLSYILLDLRQAGVTVRPLKQITGDSEFTEVFFTDAVAPVEWTVGQRGEGWSVSRTTLRHERNYIGGADRAAATFNSLLGLARTAQRDGRPAIADAEVRQRLATIAGHLQSLRYSSYRQVSMVARGQDAGLIGLVAKLYATNIGHEHARLARDLIGDDLMLAPMLADGHTLKRGPEKWTNQFMGSLGVAIAGGASNIQRNIIAERGLGLRFKDPV